MPLGAIDNQIGDSVIEPAWVDSQSHPARGAQAYEQAIVQDGVETMIINWHGCVAVSCMDIAATHKVPHDCLSGPTEVENET